MSDTRTRSSRKVKKSKTKILLSIVFGLLIVLLATLGYAYQQYREGLNASKDEAPAEQEIDFNGVADQMGRVNVLLLGSDSRGEEHPRTDTIIIAQYDPETKMSKLASIMRDTYVEIPGYDYYKINTAYELGGVELLRQTIKQNFGVDVQYYAVVDFTGFTKTIDTAFPNGIEVNVEHEMEEGIGLKLEPGLQRLNGEQLLGYVRFRKDNQNDFGRVARQQEVLKEITNELASLSGLAKLPKMIGIVQPYIQTNIDNDEIFSLATSILTGGAPEIESLRIPLDGAYSDARISGVGLVLEPDLEANSAALQEFLESK